VNTEKVSPHLTARIVQGYVRHHRLGPDQLPDLIASIHRALGQLGQPPEPDEIRTPAVTVRRSVHRDYVICLDCGYRGKTLRRHIGTRHGLSADEYRRRWGLRSNHLLTAPAYSEHRSTLAKKVGLGRKSTTAVQMSPKPRRTSRSRSKSVTETAAEPRARQRRPRSRVAPAQSEPPSTPAEPCRDHGRSCWPFGEHRRSAGADRPGRGRTAVLTAAGLFPSTND
jgi:predicted transcriptional regulator